jgi:hypothetical protein
MFKPVMRWSASERMLRLFRVVWNVGEAGDGRGYSAKVSVGLELRWFYFQREWQAWRLTVCGLHLSHRRHYGGRFA